MFNVYSLKNKKKPQLSKQHLSKDVFIQIKFSA